MSARDNFFPSSFAGAWKCRKCITEGGAPRYGFHLTSRTGAAGWGDILRVMRGFIPSISPERTLSLSVWVPRLPEHVCNPQRWAQQSLGERGCGPLPATGRAPLGICLMTCGREPLGVPAASGDTSRNCTSSLWSLFCPRSLCCCLQCCSCDCMEATGWPSLRSLHVTSSRLAVSSTRKHPRGASGELQHTMTVVSGFSLPDPQEMPPEDNLHLGREEQSGTGLGFLTTQKPLQEPTTFWGQFQAPRVLLFKCIWNWVPKSHTIPNAQPCGSPSSCH